MQGIHTTKLLLIIGSFVWARSQVLQLLDGRAGILDVLDEEVRSPRDLVLDLCRGSNLWTWWLIQYLLSSPSCSSSEFGLIWVGGQELILSSFAIGRMWLDLQLHLTDQPTLHQGCDAQSVGRVLCIQGEDRPLVMLLAAYNKRICSFDTSMTSLPWEPSRTQCRHVRIVSLPELQCFLNLCWIADCANQWDRNGSKASGSCSMVGTCWNPKSTPKTGTFFDCLRQHDPLESLAAQGQAQHPRLVKPKTGGKLLFGVWFPVGPGDPNWPELIWIELIWIAWGNLGKQWHTRPDFTKVRHFAGEVMVPDDTGKHGKHGKLWCL